jgi:sugar lactone lactonase YvrE
VTVDRFGARATSGNDERSELGEGPVWDAHEGCLRWVDSEVGAVFRGFLDGDDLRIDDVRLLGEKIGSLTPATDGGLLVAGERAVHIFDAEGILRASIPVIAEGVRSRLNDGTVDPAGRFLVGSIRLDDRVRSESVWAIGPDRTVREVITGVTVSNGIGFSPDGRTLYHVETRPGAIRAFDYDVTTGTAANMRNILVCGATPDGLAVDVNGDLWVAFFGEGEVRCISPEGMVRAVIEVNAPNVTCPEFVGTALDRLVITTARFRMAAEERDRWPDAGAVFVAHPGTAGLAVPVWTGSTDRSGSR